MLEIVTRKAWRAMPNQWDIPSVEHPATSVFVFYTGNEDRCLDREECDPVVRELQRYHIEDKRDIPDFPYSFLVSATGLVYEGRGWEYSVPEPFDRKDLANKRYIIAYISNDFEMEEGDAYNTVQELIQYGIKHNFIVKDYEKYSWDMEEVSSTDMLKIEEEDAEAMRQAEIEEATYKDNF